MQKALKQEAQSPPPKKTGRTKPWRVGGEAHRQSEKSDDSPKPHNNPNDEPEWFRRYQEAQDERLELLEGE